MTDRCAVCGTALQTPLYRSSSAESLTSLCTIEPHPVVVFGCLACGHLQTPPLADLDVYYGTAYRILIESDEEDQLYEVAGDRQIFRADHQADTLLAALDIPSGARILDYGSAKGATMRKVAAARPDLQLHLFDVSEMWVPFWQRFVPVPDYAIRKVPPAWSSSFDVVASFFMLEHVEQPVEVLRIMRSLLRPGGHLYAVVPNPAVNIADFVVIDHVNHFTGSSLERAFTAAGLECVTLDENVHDGAWVAIGRRPGSDLTAAMPRHDAASSVRQGCNLAAYWGGLQASISAAEGLVGESPSAVYGAGFYGSFIRTCLYWPERVVAYIDQNPYLQGTKKCDRPVVAPVDLDPSVTDVYVGLNPRVARTIINGIAAWRDRGIRFHYLGEPEAVLDRG